MKIIGIQKSKNTSGEVITTLHVSEQFAPYYNDSAAERIAIGEKAVSLYVGTYDCSDLKVGMEVEIFYGQPVNGKNGKAYAPVKFIQIVNERN